MSYNADTPADAGPSSASTSTRPATASRQAGQAKPAKVKLTRSKAACDACHKAKHWGIDCLFPSAAGPTPSVKSNASRSSTPTRPTRGTAPIAPAVALPPPPPASFQHPYQFPPPPPPLYTFTTTALPASVSGGVTPASTATAPHPSAPGGTTPDVAEQLKRMNERLESLESALARATSLAAGPAPAASALFASHGHGPSHAGSESSPMAAGITPRSTHAVAAEAHHDGAGANAVETAGEAMAVEGLVDLGAAQARGADGTAAQATWESIKPDVLGRGIMTLDECDAEFDFYFAHLQPWTALLSTTLDRHPLVVRERSPLLFHSILLVTLYYRPRTPANLALYRAVSSILDSILAPQILCPQPDQLSFDFCRAAHLLLLYKPVQYSALNARGISDPAQIESASKINVRASWMLRLLVSRVSAFVGLPSVANSFALAFANQHISPIPEALIAQERLYLGCVFHESHGALQSGKTANFDPHAASHTTRLFAQLRNQPSDVRLAASVELVAHAATALNARAAAAGAESGGGGNGVPDEDDLRRFDDDLEAWHEYWAPLVASAQAHDGADSVAWSLWYPYASFARLNLRGAAFNKWKAERKDRAAGQPGGGAGAGAGQAALEVDERENIAIAAEVAQEMMLAITVDGDELRSGRRGARAEWRSETGPLVPDPEVVRTLKYASDSLTCVMFSYAIIFLGKLANEGLLRPDLTVIDAGSPPLPPMPMSPNDRLCRLFQLGADFLDAIAPTPHHPAVRQAAFLRKVLDAAISGRRSTTSAPSSPKLGAKTSPFAPHALSRELESAAARQSEQQRQQSRPLGPPALAPATVPPPPLPPPHRAQHPSSTHASGFSSTIAANGSAAAALSAHGDFSLSTSYQPTPMHSPPPPSQQQQQAEHLQRGDGAGSSSASHIAPPPVVEDPFAALLSGVSPSMYDAGQAFFALDAGIDWSALSGTHDAQGLGQGGYSLF
ncbi:uncharacterized protein RHOBADRAFT_52244 [Rhodotorula graminis WP1]|uniref:Transcription factor domain-containing protein n=1 Tax=Rhodotorula graminis (strain WP1) TaxID=578459 RepID=A0A194S6N0_RHOGW|nr:uncharacterized protein RHOBADRAFT_52244 [Rhodotorula graminis WP1]KPV76204.1 hypothetical protein RHOBADRAFT_52244 [Rhodotorula graminis WP1]